VIRTQDLANQAVAGRTLTTRSEPGAPAPRRPPIVDLATYGEPTVTVAELAAYWKVCLRTIYRDISKGALPAYRTPGGTIRIRIEDARGYGRPVE
jgi:excisionase family DNA binding protein